MKQIILFLTIIAFAACTTSDSKKNDQDSTVQSAPDTTLNKTADAGDVDSTDLFFMKNAALGGLTEVEASKLILTSTEDKNVMAFAKMMVSDHGKANTQLLELAKGKGYQVPSNLTTEKTELVNKMKTLKLEARNEYYIKLMANEHNQAIDLFTKGSQSDDEEVRKFATNTLPTLKNHYQHVMKLDTIFQTPKANQGDDRLKISDRKSATAEKNKQ